MLLLTDENDKQKVEKRDAFQWDNFSWEVFFELSLVVTKYCYCLSPGCNTWVEMKTADLNIYNQIHKRK